MENLVSLSACVSVEPRLCGLTYLELVCEGSSLGTETGHPTIL